MLTQTALSEMTYTLGKVGELVSSSVIRQAIISSIVSLLEPGQRIYKVNYTTLEVESEYFIGFHEWKHDNRGHRTALMSRDMRRTYTDDYLIRDLTIVDKTDKSKRFLSEEAANQALRIHKLWLLKTLSSELNPEFSQ